MQDSSDLHKTAFETVYNDKRKRGENQFASASDFPLASSRRKLFQRSNAIVYAPRNTVRGGGVLDADVFEDSGEVNGGFRRPPNRCHIQERSIRSIWRRTSSCETDLPLSREASPFPTSCLNHSSWSRCVAISSWTIWSGSLPVCEAIRFNLASSSGASETSMKLIVVLPAEPKQSTIKNQQSAIPSPCLRVSVVK